MIGATGTIPFINTNLDTSLDSPVDYTYNTRPSDSAAWTAEIDGDNTSVFGYSLPTAKIIKSSNTMTDPLGDILKVTYKAHISKTTIAGTYTGHATYILAPNVPEGASIRNTMQGWNGCSSMAPGSLVTLTDLRDGKRYNVSKLADDNCYMVQNLALMPGTQIDSEESDLPSGATYIIPTTTAFSDNNGEDAVFGNHTDGDSDSFGVYYSLAAATAGASNNISDGDVTQSICPKGWTLPTSTQFSVLVGKYSDKSSFDSAWHTVLAGNYRSGGFADGGAAGFWWSSKVSSGLFGFYLYERDPSTLSVSNNTKNYGNSVRCVFVGGISDVGAAPYAVTYMLNGGVDGPEKLNSNSGLVTLSSTEPTREGFRFLGWSADKYATVATLKSGQQVTLTSDNPRIVLYAVWEDLAPKLGDMQSASTITACKNLGTGEKGIVTDNRDGKKYYVQKLADGNCWMMQDLDLDLYVENNNDTTALVAATGRMGTKDKSGNFVPFTNSNTNISGSSWTVSGDNVAYNTQKSSAQNGSSYAWDSDGAVWDDDTGDYVGYEVRSYDGNNNYCMKTYSTKISDNFGDNEDASSSVVLCGAAGSGTVDNNVGAPNTQRIGNYYNWPAATAGTGTYQVSTQNTTVSDSICPKGWHLPYGGTSSDTIGTSNSAPGGFGYLFKSEGVVSSTILSTTMKDTIMQYVTGYTATPTGKHTLTFLRSGRYDYSLGTVRYRGYYGNYWSSTVQSLDFTYILTFLISYLYPGTNGSLKGAGYSVRCVAD